ncbi:hypothetical protein FRC03_012807 [Tulasnella sp. 419]|nr:hypothetical protein FRC03_012807 [Tulasnella sp. 419]
MSERFYPDHFPPEHGEIIRLSNDSSPIYSLPNELLEKIFQASIQPWHFNNDTEDIDELGRQWIRTTIGLASVSYRWHEVVHGCPRMWSRLNGRLDLENVKFLLSKSKNAPLVIGCRVLDEGFAELIKPHIERWRIFRVFISRLCASSMKSLLTETPAPLLKSFVILQTKFTDTDETNRVLFAGHAPRLQRLRLIPYPTRWEPKGLSGLLNLQICVSHTTHPGTPSQFFHLLALSSPLLETLRIFELFSSWGHRNYEWDSSVVTLPRLKRLRLERPPFHLLGFMFSFLKVSPSLRLRVRSRSAQPPSLLDVFPLSMPPDNPVAAAISRCYKLRIMHILSSLAVTGNCLEEGDESRVMKSDQYASMKQVQLEFDSIFPSVARLYDLLLYSGCIAQITSLNLSGHLVLSEPRVFDLFYCLEKLIDLTLEDCTNGSSKLFALISTSQTSESGDINWPCVNLLHLGIIRVECSAEDVINCIRSRCKVANEGAPGTPSRLKTLTIERLPSWIPLSEEEVSLLETLVDNCNINNW